MIEEERTLRTLTPRSMLERYSSATRRTPPNSMDERDDNVKGNA